MQDLQNYQYYDPSPQLTPEPWWRRARTWKLAGLAAVAAIVLVFVVIAGANALKNRKLANAEQDLMSQADAIESQLGSECAEGDIACLERARADAARALGTSKACDELTGESYSTCVALIAQDAKDPELCRSLSGEEQTACLDTTYLMQANDNFLLPLCDQISTPQTRAACRVQVKAKIVAQGRCAEAGVDVAICEAAAQVAEAIKAGDPAVCAALPDEQQQYDCTEGITSVDTDDDGLVLADEVSRGLSDTIPDGDADGLTDGDEVHVHATDPTKADTDGDGFSDGTEVDGGYDPLK